MLFIIILRQKILAGGIPDKVGYMVTQLTVEVCQTCRLVNEGKGRRKALLECSITALYTSSRVLASNP